MTADTQPTEGLPLVLEYVPFSHQLVATNRLSEDEDGASQVAADHVVRWFGLWAESAWRRESAPADPRPELSAGWHYEESREEYERRVTPDAPAGQTWDHWRVAMPDAPAGLDVERLARALRYIHGDRVPLPNHATVEEYARVIVESDARLAAEYEKAE